MFKSPIISSGHLENKLMYPHRNPGMEIVLVEQGGLEWAVEGVPEALKPGTVFFTLPWQTHGSMHIREPQNKIYFVLFELLKPYERGAARFQFPKALGFTPTEERELSRTFTEAPHHAWMGSELLQQLFPEMVRRLETGETLERTVAFSLLRTLIADLAQTIRSTPEANGYCSSSVAAVRDFFKGIATELDQSWTLDSMAAACGIKRTYFATITRRLSGYPPMHYLNRIRFERSCGLLRDTALPVTDIAFMCGYNSSQYFSETFRKYARMTPTDYRNSLPELEKLLEINWNHPEARTVDDERRRMKTMTSG
ncbi:AraC family transcriptional regulator [Pontiellaceae bacterium B12227]|nr:AraC family transcriptional regulator [Pontiellaceae bacterium B12227]